MSNGPRSTGSVLTGSGVIAPPHAVTTEILCATFNQWAVRAGQPESSPDFVLRVSGIRSRHFVDASGILDPDRMCPDIPERTDDEMSVQAELAFQAAERALEAAGRAGEEVDLVIVGASSLARPYPAIAIEVQDRLRARGTAFDLSVGCSSGTYGIQLAVHTVAAGAARCALVITPEIPSAYSNFRDRDSHFILGDAAAAVVIEPESQARPGAFEIVSTASLARYSTNVRNNFGFLNRCAPAEARDAADKLFYQDGRRVFGDIVRLVPRFITDQLHAHGLRPEDVRRFWLHQANGRMNEAIIKRLLGEETLDPVRAPSVLDTYANTAAAGALIAFDHHAADLEPGDYGVLCAFGAGYTVGSQLLRRL